MKILLGAGTSYFFVIPISINNILPYRVNSKNKTRYVSIYNKRYIKKLSYNLPSNIGLSAVVKNQKNNKIIDFQAIQRLNAGDLFFPYLVGLIEGDGWFSLTKNGKYLKYEFGIEMNIRDIQLLHKIKQNLGVGTIDIRDTDKTKRTGVLFRIRNKTHLKNIIIPILDKYPLLSNKQYDYLRFKEVLLSDTIITTDLIKYVRPKEIIKNSDKFEYINTNYFQAWLIGFIEAESSFTTYKPSLSSSKVASFEISQTNGYDLIEAIKFYLSLTSKIYTDKTDNSNLKVTSIRQIENIIKFIQKAPVKLMGYKKLQYLLFIKELRQIPRYSNKIKIPQNY